MTTEQITNVEAKRKAVELAKDIVRLAKLLGVPEESFQKDWDSLCRRLDATFYATAKLELDKLCGKFADKEYTWVKKGRFIVVEGGSVNERKIFAGKCFLWAVLALYYNAETPKMIEACDLVPAVGNFNDDRFELVDDLKATSCLCVNEISEKTRPRENTDGPMLLESVFHHRLTNSKPTIITVSEPIGDKRSSDINNFIGWGNTLQGVMQNLRLNWAKQSRVWRVKLNDTDKA
jgi:hypothetical protein